MKLIYDKDMGSHFLTIGEKVTVYLNNDWKQIFQIKRCNWYSFYLIYLYFEIDAMSKIYEITCILLGFGFNIRIDRDFEHSEIKQRADEAWKEIQAREPED